MKTIAALLLLLTAACDLPMLPSGPDTITTRRCTHGCGPGDIDDLTTND